MGRQIRVGDYVQLDSGHEGYVEDIGWRVTKIRMLANHMALVPNAKLSQTILVNCYLPNRELAVTMESTVAYGSALAKVEPCGAVLHEVQSRVGAAELIVARDRH